MSGFEKFDLYADSFNKVAEIAAGELTAAGFTPDPKMIKSDTQQGGLGRHTELKGDINVDLLRRIAKWNVTFRGASDGLPHRLDETPAFKEFVSREDIEYWGHNSCGWGAGYTINTPEALKAFSNLIDNEPMHTMTTEKSK